MPQARDGRPLEGTVLRVLTRTSSFFDLISQQRGRIAPAAEDSEPSGERLALGNPSARRALSASGARRRRLLTPPTRPLFPIGDRFPCNPFPRAPAFRGAPREGERETAAMENRTGYMGVPLTRFPTTPPARGGRSERAPILGCRFAPIPFRAGAFPVGSFLPLPFRQPYARGGPSTTLLVMCSLSLRPVPAKPVPEGTRQTGTPRERGRCFHTMENRTGRTEGP